MPADACWDLEIALSLSLSLFSPGRQNNEPLYLIRDADRFHIYLCRVLASQSGPLELTALFPSFSFRSLRHSVRRRRSQLLHAPATTGHRVK